MLDVPERLDVGAELVEALGEAFVAAVDDVRRPQDRGPLRCQHRQQDHHGGAERGRAHDLGAREVRGALDHDAVRVEQLDRAAQLVELDEVDGAVLVDPVVGGLLPGVELLRLEPESDLLLGRLDGVGAVADVAADVL